MNEEQAGTAPLQKWLQRLGVGSKRAVRELIQTGRVSVNGQPVLRFARPVSPEDVITIDGRTLTGRDTGGKKGIPVDDLRRIVLLMNKPVKHITALSQDETRPALGRYLPPDAPRLFHVGRLDFNTEGALLWTNDGELARRILHPDWALPKQYAVKIRGHIQPEDRSLERMRCGMTVGDSTYQPAEVSIRAYRTRATWVDIVICEGKPRQIRRMCRACGYQIVKLRRTAIGPIRLGDLNPRCVRWLSESEVESLCRAVGLVGEGTR